MSRLARPCSLAVSALAAALMLASPLQADAQQRVYQWKDAQGRTQYSGTPPRAGTAYTVRGTSGAAPAAEAAPQAAPAESAQCKQARANLTMLRGNGPVQMAGADGAPSRLLNDQERAAQARIAEAVLEANCNGHPSS